MMVKLLSQTPTLKMPERILLKIQDPTILNARRTCKHKAWNYANKSAFNVDFRGYEYVTTAEDRTGSDSSTVHRNLNSIERILLVKIKMVDSCQSVLNSQMT